LQLQFLPPRYSDTARKNSPHLRDVLYIWSGQRGLRLSFVEVPGGVKKAEHSSVKFLREFIFFLFSSQAKHFVACKHYTSLR